MKTWSYAQENALSLRKNMHVQNTYVLKLNLLVTIQWF